MSSPRFDGSTLDLSRTGMDVVWGKGDLAFEPIPTLTILFHPQAPRVGARAYLGQIVRGREARLSRLEPDFEQPGSQAPLNDPYLSRRPIRFLPVPGGIEIRLDEGHTRIVLNGEPVDGGRVLSLAEIREGAVLEMAGRVVLLLHLFVPPRLPVCEPHGLVGESSAIAQVRAEIQSRRRSRGPGPDPGRDGDGQGAGRAGDPCRQPQVSRSVRQRQPGRHSPVARRLGAVRRGPRGLYGRGAGPGRVLPEGPGGHSLSR